MSENKPITKVEKMLVNILVKLYSKDKLAEEIENCKYGNESSLVLGASKLIGLPRIEIMALGIQYLNYALENYEKIQNNEFPDEIERVVKVEMFAYETEIVTHYNYKRLRLRTLKKYYEEIEDNIFNNMYDYDVDTIDTDYGDSDFVKFEPDRNATKFISYSNNYIE